MAQRLRKGTKVEKRKPQNKGSDDFRLSPGQEMYERNQGRYLSDKERGRTARERKGRGAKMKRQNKRKLEKKAEERAEAGDIREAAASPRCLCLL